MLRRWLAALLLVFPALAQPRRALTAADYARAESFLSYNIDPLVFHTALRTTWLTRRT